ncbi:MAG: hypothetical protein IJ775_07230 [Muribaculaceae bacterium]|nr:hypothetical protein [Muribaculaceae bacterium]
MSKRSLLIIIMLLAIIDIVAAFWYLAVRIEASGDSRDLFSIRTDTAQVQVADTIIDTNVPDTFMIAERHAYFVSVHPAVKGDNSTYYACTMRVKVRWPQSVNGSNNVKSLEQALMAKMFSAASNSLDQGMAMFLAKPTFSAPGKIDYKLLTKRPTPKPAYASRRTVMAFPVMTSMRLLVMGIEKHDHIGNEKTTHSAFVHYDRGMHRVLNKKDIFQREDAAVVAIINKKIDALSKIQLKHADTFPTEFQIKAKGICFYFSPGMVADTAEGPIEIFVDYGSLRSVFTPAFKQLVDTNDGFWDYKPLSLD